MMLIVAKFKVSKVPSQELVDSISRSSVINPIAVVEGDVTKIIDGHLRVAACKILGIPEIQAFGVTVTETEFTELKTTQKSETGWEYKKWVEGICNKYPDMTLRELKRMLR